MTVERYRASNEADFRAFAARFARTLAPGMTVALSGGLGAGKTVFAQAIVASLQGRTDVPSPTFTLWHRYEGEPPVNHLDLYRIEDPAEAAAIGLDEAFDGRSITLVEWPERAGALLPAGAIRVGIAGAGDEPREVTVERP